MIKEIKKGDRFSHPYAGGQELAEFQSYDGKYHFTVDGSPDIKLIVDSEIFKSDFKYVSSKTERVPASCMPIASFQNYSKEYLDNAQELQAVCDARKPDGHDLGAYIKTGRIDVDKDFPLATSLNKSNSHDFENILGGGLLISDKFIKTGIIDTDPKLIRRFKSGAVRGDNTGRVRPDWISPYAIEEISKVLIENANDFGACNYFLGIDEEACLESMARHIEELKEAILITKDMTKAKVIARSVGFNAVAMLHTMVLKEKGLYKEHFDATELVTVEEAKKSNRFVG